MNANTENGLSWFRWIVGALVLIVVLVLGVGAMLPQNHVASRTVQLPQSPDRVWSAISDVAKYPSWRSDVVSVDMLPVPSGAQVAWRENAKHGSLSYVATDAVQPSHFATHITDTDKPFGGGWLFEISPARNGGSTLTITEYGEVYNPLFRFVSRFIIGHTRTIDTYIADLRKHIAT